MKKSLSVFLALLSCLSLFSAVSAEEGDRDAALSCITIGGKRYVLDREQTNYVFEQQAYSSDITVQTASEGAIAEKPVLLQTVNGNKDYARFSVEVTAADQVTKRTYEFTCANGLRPATDSCDVREKASTPMPGCNYLVSRTGLKIDTLYRFDLSGMFRADRLREAKLMIHCNRNGSDVYAIPREAESGSWGEERTAGNGISRADAPALQEIICTDPQCSHSISEPPYCSSTQHITSAGWYTFDVTNYIKQAIKMGKTEAVVGLESFVIQQSALTTFESVSALDTALHPKMVYSFYDAENDADLREVSFRDGIFDRTFQSEETDYQVGLPDDAVEVPEMQYTLSGSYSKILSVSQAENIGDTAQITIQAENGDQKTYHFTIVHYSDIGLSEDGDIQARKPELSGSILPGGEISVKSNVRNNATREQSAVLVVECLKNYTLIDMAVQPAMVPSGDTILSASLRLPEDITGINIAAFVLNDFDSMLPLSERYTLFEEDAEWEFFEKTVHIAYENLNEDKMEVTGKAEKPNQWYCYAVTKPGKTISDTANEPPMNVFESLDLTYSNEDKNYGFRFGVKGEEGLYNLHINETEIPFFYTAKEVRQRLVENLYQSKSSAELGRILDLGNRQGNSAKILSLAIPESEKIDFSSFYETLYALNNEKPFDGVDLNCFQTQFRQALMMERLRAGEIEDIGKLKRVLELGEAVWNEYDELNAAQKQTISKIYLKGKTYRTLAQMEDILWSGTLLTLVNEPNGVSDILRVLKQYPERLELPEKQYQTYQNLSSAQKTKVAQKLAQNTYMDRAALGRSFSKAVSEVSEHKTTSNTGGGGSRPSSGSGNVNLGGTPQNPSVPTETITGERLPSFCDLEGYQWAVNAISVLYGKEVISGVSEFYFEPERYIQREEFLKMAISLSEEPNQMEPLNFSDVNPKAWYYPSLQKAFALGLLYGNEDGTAGIGLNLTREDMAVVLNRLLLSLNFSGAAGGENEKFNDDSEISDYAKEAVYVLRSAGIVNGTGDNRFSPKRYVTRAEAAQALYNLFSSAGLL